MTSDLAWSSALFRLSARQEGSSAGSGMGPKRRDVARGCTYCAEAEIYERHAVLTLDSDFSVYRKDRCRARTSSTRRRGRFWDHHPHPGSTTLRSCTAKREPETIATLGEV